MYQLIEKMTDDMQLRGYSPKTIYAYISHVKRFEKHFEKHPARLGEKQIRQYLLHVISQGISSSYANGCYSALRFLYETSLGMDWNMKNIPRSKKQSKLIKCKKLTGVKLYLTPKKLSKAELLFKLTGRDVTLCPCWGRGENIESP